MKGSARGDRQLLPMRLPLPDGALHGELSLPAGASAVVLFAHGSGSSRFSGRNQAVAASLRERGLGTLLMDLLSEEEAAKPASVFDVELLASRLLRAADWVASRSDGPALKLGAFGASTGAAAVLHADALRPGRFLALVSRGGRPDLAPDLERVRAPTLLIVGGADTEVLALNRRASASLRCPKELAVVPDATHLFAEAGALEAVADLAGAWFSRHLA